MKWNTGCLIIFIPVLCFSHKIWLKPCILLKVKFIFRGNIVILSSLTYTNTLNHFLKQKNNFILFSIFTPSSGKCEYLLTPNIFYENKNTYLSRLNYFCQKNLKDFNNFGWFYVFLTANFGLKRYIFDRSPLNRWE